MRGCKPTYNWWRPPTHSEIVMIHGKSRGQTNHTFGWDRGEPSWFVKQINFFLLVVSADSLTDVYPWKPEHYWGFTHSLVPSSAHAKRHTNTYIYMVCNSLYLWNGQEVSVFPILIVFLPCIAYVCCVSHELILLITFLDVLVSDTPSLFWLRKLYLSFYAFLALPSPSSDFVCRFESTCAESLCLCSQCLARNHIDFVYSDVFYGCLQVSRNKIIVVRSIMISIYTHILWYHLLININR